MTQFDRKSVRPQWRHAIRLYPVGWLKILKSCARIVYVYTIRIFRYTIMRTTDLTAILTVLLNTNCPLFLKSALFYRYRGESAALGHFSVSILFGPQFSTHFSIIKTEDIKDYSTQCWSNVWKNEKRLFFYEFNISFAVILHKWKIV